MPNRLSTRKNITNPRRIIAFAGAKQSGKNSAANFVAGMLFYSYSVIDKFKLTKDGIVMDDKEANVNDMAPKFVKIYHWADTLKQACSDMFAIDIKLLYGNDIAKNSLTHLSWEDMPFVITDKSLHSDLAQFLEEKRGGLDDDTPDFHPIYHRPGKMTVRDILQFFGTDICRKIYSNCWVYSLEQKIQKDAPMVAIIADTRFDNELFAVESWGGMTVKMNRRLEQDSHSSENGIVKFDRWTTIINNENANTIQQMHEIFTNSLKSIGAFDELI